MAGTANKATFVRNENGCRFYFRGYQEGIAEIRGKILQASLNVTREYEFFYLIQLCMLHLYNIVLLFRLC